MRVLAERGVTVFALDLLPRITRAWPDVTNPAARTEPGSPVYGMPILDVDRAGSVLVIKRSMAPGFAGIGNDLCHLPNTTMLFGDAKLVVGALVNDLPDGR